VSNSDFNETLCTCSLHKEMNLENISCGQKQFEGVKSFLVLNSVFSVIS